MSRPPKTGLADRLRALDAAVDAASGRVDPAILSEARAIVGRAGQRLRFSGAATVAALAGATGSGKSTLFNALAGSEISTPGVRRPTTAHPAAATWGDEPTAELLDWLAVQRRHHVEGAGRTTASTAWCCSTCRTTTPSRSATGWRSTGSYASSTCSSGWSTRRSTPTPRCTTTTSSRCASTRR
nr:GTPase [Raineyella fluvialis]